MELRTPPSEDPNSDFESTVLAFMNQVGYESENTAKGVKTATKDYVSILKQEPPDWIKDIWPSIALSVLHLAIAKKQPLPRDLAYPETALKSGTMNRRTDPLIPDSEIK